MMEPPNKSCMPEVFGPYYAAVDCRPMSPANGRLADDPWPIAGAAEWEGTMSEYREHEINPVDTSSLEEGDLLPSSVRVFHGSDNLSDQEVSLCDGEGGSAPSKGTRYA